MSDFRFEVGAVIMGNLGPDDWKPGTIIALRYREDHWPAEQEAPYQAVLEADHALIYVPEDDARDCRVATREDLRIARRMDALAALPPATDTQSITFCFQWLASEQPRTKQVPAEFSNS